MRRSYERRIPAARGGGVLLAVLVMIISSLEGSQNRTGFPGDRNGFRGDDTVIKTHVGNLKLANPSGGITVENVTGDCDISSGGGALLIGTVTGNVKALTTAGEIRIDSSAGSIRASTGAGNISISRAQKHVDVSTSLGEIVIEHCGSVTARTLQGGDVKLLNVSGETDVIARGNITVMINNKIPETAVCRLQTDIGNIILYLPEDFGANLEIKTPFTMDPNRETRIESDFSYRNFKQKVDKSGDFFTISTTINTGGKVIRIFVNKGNVFIKKIKK